MATANIVAAMDAGVQWLEGAVCGIGGGMAIPSTVKTIMRFLGLKKQQQKTKLSNLTES